MNKVTQLNVEPTIREHRRLYVCVCQNTHFKMVKYERSPKVFLECTICETSFDALDAEQAVRGQDD